MGAVIKKELKSYFLSPIGYVVIGIFLLIFSILFYLTTIYSQSVDMGALFYYVAMYGLMVIAPILTMRAFAEERKSGTEQLLMTSPVSITGIVLAKFIAATIMIVITELFTLMYFAILSYFSTPDFKIYLSSAFGFLLLAMTYISIGMFASSITENQIISCIITVGAVIATTFVPNMVSSLSNFSLIYILTKFLYGEITLANIVMFVTLTILFLLITITLLQRRKTVR